MVVGFWNKIKKGFSWFSDKVINNDIVKNIVNGIGDVFGVPGVHGYIKKGTDYINHALSTAQIVASNYDKAKKQKKKYTFLDGVKDFGTHIIKQPD
jgi:hypothetical protein